MFVIMVYDVAAKRVNRVRKIAEKYLFPVQHSLFQGYLSEKQLRKIQNELSLILLPDDDNVIFYKSDFGLQVDELGGSDDYDMIL